MWPIPFGRVSRPSLLRRDLPDRSSPSQARTVEMPVEMEKIVIRLSLDDHRRIAVFNHYNGRTRNPVVVGCHRVRIGTSSRDAEQVTDGDILSQMHVADENVPRFA